MNLNQSRINPIPVRMYVFWVVTWCIGTEFGYQPSWDVKIVDYEVTSREHPKIFMFKPMRAATWPIRKCPACHPRKRFRVQLCICQVQAAYLKWAYGRLEGGPIDLLNTIYCYLLLRLFFFYCFCHALAALGFGRIFAVLSWKTVGSPPRKWGDLCCFARKASVRRHESTTAILVLRGNFACQHWHVSSGPCALETQQHPIS
jgi:hypothetical protein